MKNLTQSTARLVGAALLAIFLLAAIVFAGFRDAAAGAKPYEAAQVAGWKISTAHEQTRLGSGVTVAVDRIITAAHVIAGTSIALAKRYDAVTVASVIQINEREDWAILSLRDPIGTLVPIRCSPLEPGDDVFIMSSPAATLNLLTMGSVMHAGWKIANDEAGIYVTALMVSAETGNGGSGGGVYDSAGALIGIVTARWAITETGPYVTLVVPVTEIGVGEEKICPEAS